MGSAPNAGLRVVVRDEEGNDHLRTFEELLCAGGATSEERADYNKRVLAAVRRGIDTEVALMEIVGGQRTEIRASLATHVETGRIAKDGDTYSIAKAGGSTRKAKTASKKTATKATKTKSTATSATTGKKAATSTKAATSQKAATSTKTATKMTKTQAKRQRKVQSAGAGSERVPPARRKAVKLDTSQQRADFEAATLRAVEEGALTNSSVRKIIGGSALQVTAALGRLVAAGKLVVAAEGPPARYKPASAASSAKKKTKKPKLPTLKWSSTSCKGRKGYTAPWDTGEFKLLETKTGSLALFFQRDQANYEEYGCGTSREAKKQARLIAAAGVPTAKQWHAQGGQLLGDCPVAVRRVTKSESATLTWTETIQEGRQVCVAPTADGEFKMQSTDGGSFALIFVRDGDKTAEALGSGKKSTLLKRALEIVDEEAKDAASYSTDSGDSESTETADHATDTADDTADVVTDDLDDDTDQETGIDDDRSEGDATDVESTTEAGDDSDVAASGAPPPSEQDDALMMNAFMTALQNL